MPLPDLGADLELVNGSTGDPLLFVDFPGRNDALLFDAGELGRLPRAKLADVHLVFLTHFHLDHFVGFDRILRANLDSDKTLRVFTPPGGIQRIYDRIRSYDLAFFPFMKLTLEICEVEPHRLRWGKLECARKFPPPTLSETPRQGLTVYAGPGFHVEAAAGDHTVPCLAYAFIRAAGWRLDRAKLAASSLKPGPWIGQALELSQKRGQGQTEIEIEGGRFTLADLLARCFVKAPTQRIAYVTDTFWSDGVKADLVQLANQANRLYCDAFYSKRDGKLAEKHRHMTTATAAELARAANVRELVVMHFSGRYQGRYAAHVAEAQALFPNTSADLRFADEPS